MNDVTAASCELPNVLPNVPPVDVRSHLISVADDLLRLQTLLTDACDTLIARFDGVSMQVREIQATAQSASAPARVMQQQLAEAVIALQFQDMASQLINHAHGRLRSCADGLDPAIAEMTPAFAADAIRTNPVSQREMSAGSVDLF